MLILILPIVFLCNQTINQLSSFHSREALINEGTNQNIQNDSYGVKCKSGRANEKISTLGPSASKKNQIFGPEKKQ